MSLMEGSGCMQGISLTMDDALELGRTRALHGATPAALRMFEAIGYCPLTPAHCSIGPLASCGGCNLYAVHMRKLHSALECRMFGVSASE